ncbi:MAG: hypothetical protein CMP23_07105 [Rickettsiales bacterium]|nr:hypothetical protein [Rickettsiales bacterium]|tara:strand:- start:141 stop:845 length:705 start_codon:yes stop_codon:yes gene_type:complete
MMRITVVLLALSWWAGCAPQPQADYFQLAIGNQWEYYVTAGGEEGEVWNMEVLDADDNPESGRGDVYLVMSRTEPPSGPGLASLTVDTRSFNLATQQDLTGSSPQLIGWQYKWVNNDEGDRNEYFVKEPGSRSDWSENWDYRADGNAGGTEFWFSVSERRTTDPIQTPYGTYVDCLEVEREVRLDHSDGTEQFVLHVESWAAGVGLIRYQRTGTDGDVTEVLLRTTNVAEIPGS